MLLVESQCLPPISVFVEAIRQKGLLIESCENYQKISLRNRFYTSFSGGSELTSIPLAKGKANQTSIKDVRIAYEEEWVSHLTRKIMAAYGSGAYFKFYFDDLIAIFSRNESHLFNLNMHLLKWVIDVAEISLDVNQTSTYESIAKTNIKDWRKNNLSFYLNPTSNNQLKYDQIFESQHGFIRNLSIIDLLFNRGPETGWLLNEVARK